jgi:Peptidase M15
MVKFIHAALFALVLAFGSVTIAATADAAAKSDKTYSAGKSGKKSASKSRKKSQVASRSGRRLGGGISWNAGGGCLPSVVKAALSKVAANYGPIVVNSTHRSPSHNRRVGGARKSMHMQCRAADFRVVRGGSGVLAYLQTLPGLGGIKRYNSGFFHIDDGPRRTWKG